MTYPCTKQTTLWKPTMQIHAWMSEGYETLHKAKQMGWPVPMWQSELPPTYVPTALTYPLMAQLPVIHCIPPEPLFMTGGSWHPDGRCGGCIAIVCTHTYQYTLYPVAIPISLDQSYAVELYVAWILSRVRTSLQFTDHGQWCFRGQTHTDSRSYIQALQAQNEAATPIVNRLLQIPRYPSRYRLGGLCGHSKSHSTPGVFHGRYVLVSEIRSCGASQVFSLYESGQAKVVHIASSNHAVVFKAVFASLAMPVAQEYQEYHIHKTSDWQVNWLS